MKRVAQRGHRALRPVSLQIGALKFAEGSALLELGDTRVLAAATVEARVPPFLAGGGKGWVTAEYSMLPRATATRSPREVSRGRPSGRTSEIQRLIGRSLRAVVDLAALGERTVTVDCDVLQADGGTRTAAVTAAYAALVQAFSKMLLTGDLARWPLHTAVAAVSVGVVQGAHLLDLDYEEDRQAEVDLNVVATAEGELVEIQGTGETRSFPRRELDALLEIAFGGIEELLAHQRSSLEAIMTEVEAARSSHRSRAPARSERDLWGPPRP